MRASPPPAAPARARSLARFRRSNSANMRRRRSLLILQLRLSRRALAVDVSAGCAFRASHIAFHIFAPHVVAAFAWTRRLAARTEQVACIGDRSGKITLRRAAHVGPRHVLRIAADILRPIRAVGGHGDNLKIRQPNGRRRIAIAEIRLERDRARDRCRRGATPCAPGRKRAWPPSRWARPTAP